MVKTLDHSPFPLVVAGKEISWNMEFFKPQNLVSSALYWGYARLAASREQLSIEVVSNFDGSLMDSFTLVSRIDAKTSSGAAESQSERVTSAA